MKNSIKFIALLLLSGFSLFASAPVKAVGIPLTKNNIYVQALPSPFRVGVSIQNAIEGNAFVEIKDQENHILLTDKFSKKAFQRVYNLSELTVGDYTFTIHSNNDAITKRVHIYLESGEKTWFIIQ